MSRDLRFSIGVVSAILTSACALAVAVPAPLAAQARDHAVTIGLGLTSGHPVGAVRWTLGGEMEVWNEVRIAASFTSWSFLAECAAAGGSGSSCGRDDRSWEIGLSREVGATDRVRPYVGLTTGQYRDGRTSAMIGLAAGVDVLAAAPFAVRIGGRHHELLGAEHPADLRFTALEVGAAWTRW
jgi:hypothetical protein